MRKKESLECVEKVYFELLQMPHCGDRASEEIQTALCMLRNFIARKTKRDIEDVQNQYEEIVALIKINCLNK